MIEQTGAIAALCTAEAVSGIQKPYYLLKRSCISWLYQPGLPQCGNLVHLQTLTE